MPEKDRVWLHVLLFLLTFASVMATWLVWSAHAGESLADLDAAFFGEAASFAGALLFFLTVHEFGHYFAGRFHDVRTSLPYYIPLPMLGVGTLGAVIRIREQVPTLRKLFDIGAAGPIAGFVVAFVMLLIAFATVPGPEYVMTYEGHEALKDYVAEYNRFPDAPLLEDGMTPGTTIMVGQTLLYWLVGSAFPDAPPMYEMYHYPLLFASWLALFFTALNLLPVGQLDGGHILYALVGPEWHGYLARGFVVLLLLSGSVGLMAVDPDLISPWLRKLGPARWIALSGLLYLYLRRLFDRDHALIAPALVGIVVLTAIGIVIGPAVTQFGYSGWLVWSLLIVFVIKVDHPPVLYWEPLTPNRRLLGYVSILVFMLCFSIRPLYTV